MYASEQRGNPILDEVAARIEKLSATQSGGNMEGKEVRFGIADSILWATTTTDTSCGAVNAAHDSLTPLAGGMAMLNIALGEVVFGGVGVGIMGCSSTPSWRCSSPASWSGRTPEYLGKKIEGREMKLADARGALLLRHGAGLRRPGRRGAGRQGRGPERGSARPLRDPLRHDLADRQQRQRLRRSHRQRALLEHHRRALHDVGPLLLHHPLPGAGRLAGRQEVGAAVAAARSPRPAASSSCCSSA